MNACLLNSNLSNNTTFVEYEKSRGRVVGQGDGMPMLSFVHPRRGVKGSPAYPKQRVIDIVRRVRIESEKGVVNNCRISDQSAVSVDFGRRQCSGRLFYRVIERLGFRSRK